MSSHFKELCSEWNIEQKLTTPYHPQTNMTERVNRTLKCMIAAYVEENHKKWDQYLPEFHFAINSAIQESIGMTPAELQLGRKLQSPMDKVLKSQETSVSPSDAFYDVITHLLHLKEKTK